MEKRFQAIEDLIREVETNAVDQPDTLALVVALIKFAIRSEVDPYVLNGLLIEGIANTINKRIPRRRKRQVTVEVVRLLLERLQAGGALGSGDDRKEG
jgi:hypothetical protein